ncbi:hypothetical protein AVEN_177011-1 [Araneus ventricosus]|uniref:Uncharacterized protein n=1 Tax=Araneus ventricosus TaxID=182803 RepID=A0A4Y2I1A3_ARAVE|nr:hypothetical protein AVEN_177011-1 [Araneus ventricosus]
MTTRATAFFLLSEKQPADIRPTSIQVAWPVTAGLSVRGLRHGRAWPKKKNQVTSVFWSAFNHSYSKTRKPIAQSIELAAEVCVISSKRNANVVCFS